jgi:hypothetical protein
MQPAVKETLPIVLLPLALTTVLTVLIALLALGFRMLPSEDKRLAAGFTVTVPDNPPLARRLEAALGDWLEAPQDSAPTAATAEIKRPLPNAAPLKPVVLIDL